MNESVDGGSQPVQVLRRDSYLSQSESAGQIDNTSQQQQQQQQQEDELIPLSYYNMKQDEPIYTKARIIITANLQADSNEVITYIEELNQSILRQDEEDDFTGILLLQSNTMLNLLETDSELLENYMKQLYYDSKDMENFPISNIKILLICDDIRNILFTSYTSQVLELPEEKGVDINSEGSISDIVTQIYQNFTDLSAKINAIEDEEKRNDEFNNLINYSTFLPSNNRINQINDDTYDILNIQDYMDIYCSPLSSKTLSDITKKSFNLY